MNTKKKISILEISAVCVIALGIGIFFAIRESANDRPTFTINDTLPDGQGKKATIILLAGQSNASGCSSDEYLKKKRFRRKIRAIPKRIQQCIYQLFRFG